MASAPLSTEFSRRTFPWPHSSCSKDSTCPKAHEACCAMWEEYLSQFRCSPWGFSSPCQEQERPMTLSLLGATSLRAACVASSWDLQGVTGVGLTWIRPSFWDLGGQGNTEQYRFSLAEMDTCSGVVLSPEVLAESPVSRFGWREQWFLEHVMHSNTFGGKIWVKEFI